MKSETERRLILVAGCLWLAGGVFAIIASRIAAGLPALYVLFPFIVGIALISWSWRMAENEEAAEAASAGTRDGDLPDGDPQPA